MLEVLEFLGKKLPIFLMKAFFPTVLNHDLSFLSIFLSLDLNNGDKLSKSGADNRLEKVETLCVVCLFCLFCSVTSIISLNSEIENKIKIIIITVKLSNKTIID